MEINLDDGKRSVLSGQYMDKGELKTVGEGPLFCHLLDIRKGPDGMLYGYSDPPMPSSHEIIRVDPKTGNRELVWKVRSPSLSSSAF